MANLLFLRLRIYGFSSRVVLSRVIEVDQIRLWYKWQHDHGEFSGQVYEGWVEVWVLS